MARGSLIMIEAFFQRLALILLIMIPLATWKLFDILMWIISKVNMHFE